MKSKKTKSIIRFSIFSLLTILLLGGTFALAQVEFTPSGKFETPYSIISAIQKFILMLGVPIAVIFLIIAGYMFLTSSGAMEKITKAKGILTWTLVGLVIVLAGAGIGEVIKNILGVDITDIPGFTSPVSEEAMAGYLGNPDAIEDPELKAIAEFLNSDECCSVLK